MAKKTKKENRYTELNAGTNQKILLKVLLLAAETQSRTELKVGLVEEYAEAMREGNIFPPVEIILEGGTAWVCDGWHRVLAARLINAEGTIDANVTAGTLNDAIWHAAAANRAHGQRRTNADKARAVMLALKAKPDSTNKVLAEHCGVSEQTICNYLAAGAAATEIETEAQKVIDEYEGDVSTVGAVEVKMESSDAAILHFLRMHDENETRLAALCKSEHGTFVNRQSAASDYANARSAVEQARPYKVCPLCEGNGCATCRNLGWVSRRQWDLLPHDVRG